MNRLLKEIEEAASLYGLRLNREKCELILMGAIKAAVHFGDGTAVEKTKNAKYLGAYLTAEARTDVEISRRLAESIVIWKKLAPYWKKSNGTAARKIMVFQAILHSKALYGLESAVLTAAQQNKLDVFQLKGMRQILRITTTFVDRSHSNV